MTPFNKVLAPQPVDEGVQDHGKIERVVAYWPDFQMWEVIVAGKLMSVTGPFVIGAETFWRKASAR